MAAAHTVDGIIVKTVRFGSWNVLDLGSMAALKYPHETDPALLGLGHTIRSWWMLMAEASLGEDLAIMAETGLTLPQVLTLFKLHDQSPQCVSSIAAVLHLSQPATSQLLDRLVQEGLVDRTEDPGDRRRKRLAITPKGNRLVTRLAEAKSRGLDHAAKRLSPQVRRKLTSVLQQALRQLDRGPAGAADLPIRKGQTRHEPH